MTIPIETGKTGQGPLTERLKERKEPSLGEHNPLLFPPDPENPETVDALKTVIEGNLKRLNLCHPLATETALAWDPIQRRSEPRIVIRFVPDQLSEDQLELLETLARKAYRKTVVGRTAANGQTISASFYPNLEMPRGKGKEKNEDQRKLGWYIGPNPSVPSGSHMGLFVYRDLGSSDMAAYLKSHGYKEWFFRDDLLTPLRKAVPKKYLVEIHEASLSQTDIVEFALQAASVLTNGKLIENPRLKYEVYNDLNRLGLRKTTRKDIQGLDEQLKRIERTLILPLANLDAAQGIGLEPSSVLLIGVPGTGKTLAAEYFLQQDTGIFIVPIDARHLIRELSQPLEKMTILPRISEVFKQTQIPIILQIDDLEKLGENDQMTSVTVLNLMSGVRESGFFVIASTNHPEKLTPQLLQPQRFSEIIYFGLQPEDVRLKILERHATAVSKELGRELFASQEERQFILKAVAHVTDSFTPRYLADICTQAKTFLLQRVAQLKGRSRDLTENDLTTTFTVSDWQKALEVVGKKYNRDEVVRRDKELKEFAERHSRAIGLLQNQKDGHIPDLNRVISRLKKI